MVASSTPQKTQPTTQAASDEPGILKTLRVERLEIVDPGGKVIASIGLEKHSGTCTMQLGDSITLSGGTGSSPASIAVGNISDASRSCVLIASGQDGETAGVSLLRDVKTRALFTLGNDGKACFGLIRSNGRPGWNECEY